MQMIFIDIDNTLLDFDAFIRQTMREGFAHFGLKPCEPYMEAVFHRENGKLLVSMEDTGIAIPKEEWENVFEKFYRASNHGNKDGSGLGLMVAKHIVARHFGRIWVTSDEVKKTCFFIEFPECSEETLKEL